MRSPTGRQSEGHGVRVRRAPPPAPPPPARPPTLLSDCTNVQVQVVALAKRPSCSKLRCKPSARIALPSTRRSRYGSYASIAPPCHTSCTCHWHPPISRQRVDRCLDRLRIVRVPVRQTKTIVAARSKHAWTMVRQRSRSADGFVGAACWPILQHLISGRYLGQKIPALATLLIDSNLSIVTTTTTR